MSLENRIKSIEERVMGRVGLVDPKDKLVVVSAPQSGLENELKKKEHELVQKYGPEASKHITLVAVTTSYDK